MNFKRLAWKAFSIHKNELKFVMPLLLLYFLSGAFYTIGQIFSETLFLKAYGAKGFSRFFVINGIVIIFAGIIYNYFLLKLSLRKGYIFLISIFTALIISSIFLKDLGLKWLPFYLYLGNYLFTFFLDIHFFNYSFQYLTIRNSKRILPFLMGGGKLGGILTSLIIFSIFSTNISYYGPYFWAAIGFLFIIPIILLSKIGSSRDIKAQVRKRDLMPDLKIFERFIRKIKISYSSPIFKYTLLTIFIMSVANQISEFYFARAFNTHFKTKNELAAFLSMYTFAADLLTLIIQLAFTSRIINILGVKKSNYIYPLSFFSFIGIMVTAPGLMAGILLRFYRKNLSLIIRTPIFNIIMASSPKDRLAEVKSFISAIISPMGMVAGGGAILLIYAKLTPVQGYVFALSIGLIFIILTFFQNRGYVTSLKHRITYDFSGRYQTKIEFNEYEEFFSDKVHDENSIEIMEDLFNENPSIEALDVLIKHYDYLTLQTRENILNLTRTGSYEHIKDIIVLCFNDENPIIRANTIPILRKYNIIERNSIINSIHFDNEMLTGEKLAIQYLTDEKLKKEHIKNDIDDIYNDILNGSGNPVEFIFLCYALPDKYLLNELVDLALQTKDIKLFKAIIPFADAVEKEKSRELFLTFNTADMKYLTAYNVMANLDNSVKMELLKRKHNISESNMTELFRYSKDDTILKEIYESLTENMNYYQKENYLNYLMSINIKPKVEIDRFIDYEIDMINSILDLINNISILHMQRNPKTDILKKIILLTLTDSIELHKHLILKAIAIVSGINIDEVYESSLLLKDKDLESFLMEYIETEKHGSKRVSDLFERISTDQYSFHTAPMKKNFQAVKIAIDYISSFNPEIKIPGIISINVTTENIKNRVIRKKEYRLLLKKGDDVMLQLLEKILFLKENNLFRDLNANELVHIAKITNEIEMPAEELIIKKGEFGDELFIIVEGEVEIFTDEKFITRVSEGSCIGELSIIDTEPRSSNVKTTKKSRLLSIKRKDFLLTLKENPTISINIMKMLTERLRHQL